MKVTLILGKYLFLHGKKRERRLNDDYYIHLLLPFLFLSYFSLLNINYSIIFPNFEWNTSSALMMRLSTQPP